MAEQPTSAVLERVLLVPILLIVVLTTVIAAGKLVSAPIWFALRAVGYNQSGHPWVTLAIRGFILVTWCGLAAWMLRQGGGLLSKVRETESGDKDGPV